MNLSGRILRLRKGAGVFSRGIGLLWKSSPGLSLLTVTVMTFQGIVPLVPLYAVKLMVDTLAAGGGFAEILPVIMLTGAALLLSALFRTGGNFLRQVQGQVLSDYMQGVVQQKSVELDLAYYEVPEFHDKLHRAQAEAPYRPAQIVDIVTGLISSAVSIAGIAGLLIYTLPWFTILLLAVSALPVALVLLSSSARIYAWRMEQTSSERHVFYLNWLLTDKTNVRENRINGLQDHFQEKASSWRIRLRRELLSLTGRRAAGEFFAVAFQSLITIGLLGYFAYTSITSGTSLGNLVLFFQAIQRGQQAMSDLLRGVARLYETNLYLSAVFEFLNLPVEVEKVKEATGEGKAGGDGPLIDDSRGLSVESVSFHYPGTANKVLDRVSLKIAPGEFVAIVGDNGAGKSTLINLLCRFYEPDEGRVCLNGTDLRSLEPEEYRKNLGVLFQDFTHYYYTAAENIRYGDITNDNNSALHEAAEKVGAHEFLKALPDGYGTVLGRWLEDGAELSGGQWKKVALARTVFRGAPFTILDEPTAELDPPSESDFIDNIRGIVGGGSLLLVSHKIAAARRADRIYVMRGGRVIEEGSHDELVQAAGYYAGLYHTQLRQIKES